MNKIQNILNKSGKTLVFLLFASSITFATQSCKKEVVTINPTTTEKYKEFSSAMQKLWADHMQYTYATVDAYFNQPDALTASLNRLMKNQEDIGAAIVPYYGQDAGNQLTTLLKGHINGAVPVLAAAQSGDQAALDKAVSDWRQNGKEIADFLSNANPENWKQEHMRMHMDDHLTKTIAYAVNLLQKDYTAAVANYDEAFKDMVIHFAPSLADGIAKQFPNKF